MSNCGDVSDWKNYSETNEDKEENKIIFFQNFKKQLTN